MNEKIKIISSLCLILIIALVRYFKISYALIIKACILIVILLFINRIFLLIRTHRMEKLAKKFNLRFEGEKRLWKLWLVNSEDKLNIISGELNGISIEIYDYCADNDYATGGDGRGFFNFRYSYSTKYTVFSKNNHRQTLKGLVWKFPKIKVVRKWLQSILDGKDYELKYSPIANNIKIFLFFIISIIIIFSIFTFTAVN